MDVPYVIIRHHWPPTPLPLGDDVICERSLSHRILALHVLETNRLADVCMSSLPVVFSIMEQVLNGDNFEAAYNCSIYASCKQIYLNVRNNN